MLTERTEAKTGLLLVGHGTRSVIGVEQFLSLAARVSRVLRPLPVEPAFLELAEPSIDAAVGKLADCPVERMVIAPVLLFAAGHAKEDVPSAVSEALRRRGRESMDQVQAAHMGCHPTLLELSQRRLDDALGGAESDSSDRVDSSSTCHLLVGRGSRDDSATAEMYEFARQRQLTTGFATEVGFLAMARPSFADQLKAIASRGFRRVIVQPHLLFHGDLADSIVRQAGEAKQRSPSIEWIVTGLLADPPGVTSFASELLACVVVGRCKAAGIRVAATCADD